jgi:hypothetical protein
MPLPEQADDIARLIDNDCKQTGNISTQHTYVEALQVGDSGVLSPKHNLPSLFVIEPNLSFHNNRIGQASHTAEAMLGHNSLETEYCQ